VVQQIFLLVLPLDEFVDRLGSPDDAVELIKRFLFVLPFGAR